MFRIHSLALCLAICFASTTAHAVLITQLLPNVSILGNAYNVSIIYDPDTSGSFDALMPSLTFSTSADAFAAVNAIQAAAGNGYSFSEGTGSSDGFRVAYASTATTYDYVTGRALDNSEGAGPFGPFLARDRTGGNNFSFALFERVGLNVPEPGTLVLLGIAGFAAMRKRKVR